MLETAMLGFLYFDLGLGRVQTRGLLREDPKRTSPILKGQRTGSKHSVSHHEVVTCLMEHLEPPSEKFQVGKYDTTTLCFQRIWTQVVMS